MRMNVRGWEGWGLPLLLIVGLVTYLGFGLDHLFGWSSTRPWAIGIGMIVCGGAVIVIGFRRGGRRALKADDCGTEMKSVRHRVMFIPVQYWGMVLVAVGLFDLIAGGGRGI